jgi:Leucine-rich repeat (LRR) protein
VIWHCTGLARGILPFSKFDLAEEYMKANKMFQWAIRISLMSVIVSGFLAIPNQTTSAKPLSAPFTNCANQTEIPEVECVALVALYNSTSGASWTTNTGWLQTNTPCSWFQVSCDSGHVTSLYLASNQLSGSISPELGNLANLTQLGFPNNQLSGSIPTQLGNLANLTQLDLSYNQLSGSIPTQLGNLAYLYTLDLRFNQLSGSIPTQLGNLTNLDWLDLGGNQLSGPIPIEFGNLTQLYILYLFDNQLTGSIPSELINIKNIDTLSLGRNQLSGSIPSGLGTLTNLSSLDLESNQLSGSIPPEFGNLTRLHYLYMSGNQLSGEFPTSITNLVSLYYFSFDSCQGLTSTDANVVTFLNTFNPNWNVCDQNMVVQRVGSGIPIANGDTTPSYAEGTEFGGVHIDRARSFEFKVLNTGSIAELHLTGNPIVVISGDPSFTVKYQPDPTVWPDPWGSTFAIRFSPSSVGLHTATVSIANNDPDDNPYTFTIQGVGAKKDAYEADNDFPTAKTITPAVPQDHSIYPAGDHDYEKFTLTDSSSIVLETSGPNGYDTEIALYDASQNLIGYDNDGGDFLYSRIERTCANPLPAGTYYLMTYIYEGVIPQYQLAYSTAKCPPIVKSIVRASDNPINGMSVNFTVTFSEDVTDVDMTGPSFDDFALTTSPGISGASVTGVSGSGKTYTVTVNTGSGNGMIRLDMPAISNVIDVAGNQLGNLPYTGGETYSVDKTAPTVFSITRASANPTTAITVNFTVTFSEPVTGVDMTGPAFDDFALTTSPGISGASITGVSGTGATYTVTVNTGIGNGTIRLDVIDQDTILDDTGNPLCGGGINNGNFTSGEVYKIHKSGADTIGVFRPSKATFYLRNSNSAGAPEITIKMGATTDYPVVGDWDGNGTDTIGVYHNGVFYLSNSNTTGHVDLTFAFGRAGDQPIAGDWNGDGIDTIGVYRSSKITFLLRNSNSAGAADATFKLGLPGDVGIAGDWNADGMDSTGVFRPKNGALYFKNANTTGYADIVTVYGIKNDKPVVGDWDGGGDATIGIYRNAQFYLRNTNTRGYADFHVLFGANGDMPLSGNWDGIP